MESSSSSISAFFFFVFVLISSCEGATKLVDGVSQWTNPTANIGDSIIFKHKGEVENYRLYIFRTESAFKSCNFTQATLLSDSNSTAYTWRPSRPGLFYFSFYDGTSSPCQQGQKLAIRVTSSPSASPSPSPSLTASPPSLPPTQNPNPPTILPSPSPPAETSAAPPPTSGGSVGGGGVVSSSPAYPWPFQPHEKSAGGSNPDGSGSAMSPNDDNINKGGGISTSPFINSNPAVPLPTGEIDSATFRPLPTSANSGSNHQGVEVVRLLAVLLTTISCSVFFLML